MADQFKTVELRNGNGLSVRILNYGGIVMNVMVPDRGGVFKDVALGFDQPEDYLDNPHYFGALIGRFGNRVGDGGFSLDGVEYQLERNDNGQHLHGGFNGFDKRFWEMGEVFELDGGNAVKLSLTSPDGDGGYPGELRVDVVYSLDDDNGFGIDYAAAVSGAPTIINLTNHTYFNLRGEGDGDILGHHLRLAAEKFTPDNAALVPTGEIRPVGGTPLDFRQFRIVGDRINDDYQQLKFGSGYDHNFVLDNENGDMILAAEVIEPESGRRMEVFTTEPAVQFYSGNFLDGSPGKSGKPYRQRTGFCLETQHYPDAPNKPEFPAAVLRPGETYRQKTVYRFSR